MNLKPKFKIKAVLPPFGSKLDIDPDSAGMIRACLGKELWITVDKFSAQRSSPQNRWYHGCVLPLVQKGLVELGWDDMETPEDAHEWCKKEFLSKEIINKKSGVVELMIKSTSSLTKIEFSNYIEKIRKWAAEDLCMDIPDPDPTWNLTPPIL